MAIAGPVFFDTSILLAGLVEMGAASAPACQIIDDIARGEVPQPLTAWDCRLEFYSSRRDCRPGCDSSRSWPGGWLKRRSLAASWCTTFLPIRGCGSFADAASNHVAGGRIYDAHIAETARLAGARVVVTDNQRHFMALARDGIQVCNGAEFVDALRASVTGGPPRPVPEPRTAQRLHYRFGCPILTSTAPWRGTTAENFPLARPRSFCSHMSRTGSAAAEPEIRRTSPSPRLPRARG